MILLSLDFETTGLDTAQDRVIETGVVLWSTAQHRIMEASSFLVESDKPVSQEITETTGLTQAAVDRFKHDEHGALSHITDLLNQCDALLGQNIGRFDRPVLQNWMQRKNHYAPGWEQKVVIDTLYDIPGVEGKKLQYMLADHGKLNPFPHSALTDALSAVIIVEEHTPANGNIDHILERARSPFIILQSHQGRANNKQAKELKFRWNPDYKIWWKPVKELDLDEIRIKAPFEISIRQDLTRDQLETD